MLVKKMIIKGCDNSGYNQWEWKLRLQPLEVTIKSTPIKGATIKSENKGCNH